MIQKQQELLGNYPFGGRQQAVGANNDVPSGVTFTNPIPAGFRGTSPLNSPGITANPRNRTPRIDQWNFGVQQLLAFDTVLSVDYVGSRGRHLVWTVIANTAPTPGPGPVRPRQPFPQLSSPFNLTTDLGTSDYHSLQSKLEKRFSKGVTFLASYTFSKALGTTSGPQESTPGANIYDLNASRGPLAYDVSHAFVLSSVVELPFGRGKMWLSSARGLTDALAGGWRVSGIVSAYSGFPLTPTLPFDNANTGLGTQRPNLVGDPAPSGFRQTRESWFDKGAFAVPDRFTYGNAGVGIMRAPGAKNLDLNAFKQFVFTESVKLELRFEFFNALNNTNLNAPVVNFLDPNFGRILSAREPRDIQVGIKFLW